MSLRRNPPPVETPQARAAIVHGYRSLLMLQQSNLLLFVADQGCDPKAAQQCYDAIDAIETLMSPNLLCTVLPAYTKVRGGR